MKVLFLLALFLSSSLIYAESRSYNQQNASAEVAFDGLDAEFEETPKPAPIKKVKPVPVPVKNVTIIQQKIIHVHQAAPIPAPKVVEVHVLAPIVQEVPLEQIIVHTNASLCQRIKQEHPNADSGKHFIPVKNNKEMQFFCEMELDGGGWTAIWTATKNNYRTKDFSYDIPLKYVKQMKEVVIGYILDDNIIAAVKFKKPTEWNFAHPFTSQGSDVRINAKNIINGNTYDYKLLRYGYAGFGQDCNSNWNNNTSAGRICITNTDTPFFKRFAQPSWDECSYSNSQNKALCGKKRFVILGR